jgi:2-keto-4-pentenoate hydratase/2-oxohepta-3-ene-1,7-dioic acid hydratase in catechol pathway
MYPPKGHRPPSIRDFYAFEAHVATARRARGVEMDPGWYDEPVFYFSNPAAVIGDGDVVRFPRSSAEWDYELEVAAVIGVECRDVPADGDAWLDVVAGFTIMNDWSARDLQRVEMRQGLGPAKGKDFATSLGPEVVPAVASPRGAMVARVNGVELSRGELGDERSPSPRAASRRPGYARATSSSSRSTASARSPTPSPSSFGPPPPLLLPSPIPQGAYSSVG